MKHRTGSIRAHRRPVNLLDNQFSMDERMPWQQLTYISEFLKHINYYNLENEIEGDWFQLIANDPIIFMVSLVNHPITDIKKALREFDTEGDDGIKRRDCNKLLTSWYNRINTWYDTLVKLGEDELAVHFKGIIQDVLKPQNDSLNEFQFQQFHNIIHPFLPFQTIFGRLPDSGEIDDPVRVSLHIFVKTIQRLQDITREFLEENLFSKKNHQGHTALYIAFSFLMKHVQDRINTLPQRHLDFYYREVLQQKSKGAKATRTVLSFDVMPNLPYTLVKKNTEFSAGKVLGSNEEVIFKTGEDLYALPISIEELQTLTFNKNPSVNIGTDQNTIYSVEKKHLIQKGKTVDDVDDWFIFGANENSIVNTSIVADRRASLGFIIGSPVLFLSEGLREIDLTVNFAEHEIQNKFWRLLDQICENRNTGFDIVFNQIFSEAFKISYTGKDGWKWLDSYGISYSQSDNSIILHLSLNSNAPALEPSNKIEEDLIWPSIKVLLNDYAPVFAYSFFRGVTMTAIDLDVRVEQIRNLSVYNTVGMMSLAKPFEAFGPIPTRGSYLLIGKSELFKKNLASLAIKLSWDNLPSELGGFETYYKDYNQEVGNDDFKVGFSILTSGFWSPAELADIRTYDLFEQESCLSPEGYESNRLKPVSHLNIENIGNFDISKAYELQDPMAYSLFSQAGYLRLSLMAPDFGFGSDIYEQEYAEIATYNARSKQQLPLPRKPFVPRINGISLSYTASDKLIFMPHAVRTGGSKNEGEFYHIRPSGYDPVLRDGLIKSNTLLPHFKYNGNLYLALKGITETRTVSLFFHFLRSGSTSKIVKNELAWRYFDQDNWEEFEPNQISRDDTDGFVKTGIVEITLPKTPALEGTPNNELYWIRVSVNNHIEYFPKLKGIYVNAVEAVCVSNELQVKGHNIEAGSITSPVLKHPGIKAVHQPANSYGGELAEDQDDLYTRISERLRHKERAVTMKDYEDLILEKFDTVSLVKCTNRDDQFNVTPGSLTVAVVSTRWTPTERDYFKKATLQNMKQALQEHTNPFVSVSVLNPVLEYVLVNCLVSFEKGNFSGTNMNRLNSDINRFLSPIIDSDMGVIGIGGKIYPKVVKSYLEKLPYIESVDYLSLEHITKPDQYQYNLHFHGHKNQNNIPIEATRPWSLFTPVLQHRIKVKQDDAIPQLQYDGDFGIGLLEIGSDFILDSEFMGQEANTKN